MTTKLTHVLTALVPVLGIASNVAASPKQWFTALHPSSQVENSVASNASPVYPSQREAAQISIPETPFPPQYRAIQGFGYGPVTEVLTTAANAGQTGSEICGALVTTQPQHCYSVSGGNACGTTAPLGEVVSCGNFSTDPVDETNFQEINCLGNGSGAGNWTPLLGPNDWCEIANLMPTRTQSTRYQYTNFVRLGVNRTFGGTIFELYGVDKMDRIMQNGGGAVQLSLYGDTTGFAPPGTAFGYFDVMPNTSDWQHTCDPTPYSSTAACNAVHPGDTCTYGVASTNVVDCKTAFACGGNGSSPGAPFNPIQAQAGCGYGGSAPQVDSVAPSGTRGITVSRTAPFQYTKTDQVPGLTWTETTSVYGPLVKVIYNVTYNGTVTMMPADQEIPAVFTHQGIGSSIYYYDGTAPYVSSDSPVSFVSPAIGQTIYLGLPNRVVPPNRTPTVNVTEEWGSICDTTQTQCLTVASFSPISYNITFNYNPTGSYFGVHGNFAIVPGFQTQVTVYFSPYRWDDVVLGRTIRDWLYRARSNMLPF